MSTYPYFNVLNPQSNIDRINEQINQLESMKKQMQQPVQPSINQTFQLASANTGIKYANTIDEVEREAVMFDTPYFSKDMTVMWIKSAKGDIKTYELNEIVAHDEKDIQIEMLKARIDELERKVVNESSNEYVVEPVESEEPTNVSTIRKVKRKQ